MAAHFPHAQSCFSLVSNNHDFEVHLTSPSHSHIDPFNLPQLLIFAYPRSAQNFFSQTFSPVMCARFAFLQFPRYCVVFSCYLSLSALLCVMCCRSDTFQSTLYIYQPIFLFSHRRISYVCLTAFCLRIAIEYFFSTWFLAVQQKLHLLLSNSPVHIVLGFYYSQIFLILQLQESG